MVILKWRASTGVTPYTRVKGKVKFKALRCYNYVGLSALSDSLGLGLRLVLVLVSA